MTVLKRVIAIVILILAILGLLVMMGGVIGSWAINNTVTKVGVDVLTAGADLAAVTLEAGTRVEKLLVEIQMVITNVENELARRDTGPGDGAVTSDDIAALLDTDLETLVSDAAAFFSSIEQIALALADAIDAASGLPIVAGDTEAVNQNIFHNVAGDIDALSSEVDDLLELVGRGAEQLNTQVVMELNTIIIQLNTRVTSLLTQLATINTELATLQTDLVKAQMDWSRIMDVISIVFTAIFLFVALAFLSLALHALAYFVKPDHSLRSLIPLEHRG